MYNYYTLATIFILYLIFAIVSIRDRKPYYVILHPFAVFCAIAIWRYRYAFEHSSLGPKYDAIIALGIAATSLAFGLGYFLIKPRVFERRDSVFQSRRVMTDEEDSGIAPRLFWIYSALLFLILAGDFFIEYTVNGNIYDVIFTPYNISLRDKTDHWLPFWIKPFRIVLTYVRMTTMYLAFALLLLSLRKKGNLVGTMPVFVAITNTFLALSSPAFIFSGFRTFSVFGVLAIFVLFISSYVKPENRLKKSAFPAMFLLVLYCLATLYLVAALRDSVAIHGQRSFLSIKEVVLKQFKKDGLDTNLKRGLVVEEKTKLDLENILTGTSNTEIAQTDVDSETISDETNNEGKKRYKTAEQIQKERIQLINYRPHYAISREIAWIMEFYGVHADFLGFFYPLKTIYSSLVPHSLRSVKYDIPSRLVRKERHQDIYFNSVIGNLGIGYMCYGYVGAYFHCIIIGFLVGMMARFSMVVLFSSSHHIPSVEAISIALLFYLWGPMVMAYGYEPAAYFVLFPILGFLPVFGFGRLIDFFLNREGSIAHNT